tara:strand:- start:1122 stop:1535 length:414 start_codon:yes stop_codon:yes gene_type:complete
MKYPQLKAQWIISPDPNITKQIVSAYRVLTNEDTGEPWNDLLFETEVEPWISELEFVVPAWDVKGSLIDTYANIYTTVQAITDNFHSTTIESNTVILESFNVESVIGVELEMSPFPEFYKEVEEPSLLIYPLASGVI